MRTTCTPRNANCFSHFFRFFPLASIFGDESDDVPAHDILEGSRGLSYDLSRASGSTLPSASSNGRANFTRKLALESFRSDRPCERGVLNDGGTSVLMNTGGPYQLSPSSRNRRTESSRTFISKTAEDALNGSDVYQQLRKHSGSSHVLSMRRDASSLRSNQICEMPHFFMHSSTGVPNAPSSVPSVGSDSVLGSPVRSRNSTSSHSTSTHSSSAHSFLSRSQSTHSQSTHSQSSFGQLGSSCGSSLSGRSRRISRESTYTLGSSLPTPAARSQDPNLFTHDIKHIRQSMPEVLTAALNAPPPAVHDTVRAQCNVIWVPLVCLGAILIVSFLVDVPILTEMVLYVVSHALSTAWLFGAMLLKLRGLATHLGNVAPTVLNCSANRLSDSVSKDPLAAYVQTCLHEADVELSPARHYGVRPEESLGFLSEEIATKANDVLPCLIVDSAGTIVWGNAALHRRLQYEDGSLELKSIRVLMPPAHCKRHDALLRHFLVPDPENTSRKPRTVPVVDVKGHLLMVMVSVEARAHPNNKDNVVYVGRMKFQDKADENDAAAVIQAELDSGEVDVVKSCAALDFRAENIVVINAAGVIQYVNPGLMQMLGYGHGELEGRSVNCLMADRHARQHDTYLAIYLRRLEKALVAGEMPESKVIGAGRDLYAKKKSGELVSVFIDVQRVCKPTGDVEDSFFVGCLVNVQHRKIEDYFQLHRYTNWYWRRKQPQTARLADLKWKKCTLVVIAVQGLEEPLTEEAQYEYAVLLDLVVNLCPKFKASLQTPVGDKIFVTFNLHTPCLAHRGSVGRFLSDFLSTWRTRGQSDHFRVYVAATCGEALVGKCGQAPFLQTCIYDMGSALLRAAVEAGTAESVIDDVLHEELHYAFDCRQINMMTVVPSDARSRPETVPVYELLCEGIGGGICNSSANLNTQPLLAWEACWAILRAQRGPEGRSPGHSLDYTSAMKLMETHALQHPGDAPATWLLSVLTQKQDLSSGSSSRERSGKVTYVLHYKLDPKESKNLSTSAGASTSTSTIAHQRRVLDTQRIGSGVEGVA